MNAFDLALAHGSFIHELMNAEDGFPEDLLLNEPDRGVRLIREFYEQYNENKPSYGGWGCQHEEIKAPFY